MSIVYAHNTGAYIDTDYECERVCEGCGENEWTHEDMGYLCDECYESLGDAMLEADLYNIISKLKDKGYKITVDKK